MTDSIPNFSHSESAFSPLSAGNLFSDKETDCSLFQGKTVLPSQNGPKSTVSGKEAAGRIAEIFLRANRNDPDLTASCVYEFFQNNADWRTYLFNLQKRSNDRYFFMGLYYSIMRNLFSQSALAAGLSFDAWIGAQNFEIA